MKSFVLYHEDIDELIRLCELVDLKKFAVSKPIQATMFPFSGFKVEFSPRSKPMTALERAWLEIRIEEHFLPAPQKRSK